MVIRVEVVFWGWNEIIHLGSLDQYLNSSLQVFIKYLGTGTIWINDVLLMIFREMEIGIFSFMYLPELKSGFND